MHYYTFWRHNYAFKHVFTNRFSSNSLTVKNVCANIYSRLNFLPLLRISYAGLSGNHPVCCCLPSKQDNKSLAYKLLLTKLYVCVCNFIASHENMRQFLLSVILYVCISVCIVINFCPIRIFIHKKLRSAIKKRTPNVTIL